MNIKLKVSLEEAIGRWIEKKCESDEWGETRHYVHDSLTQEMTNAAEAVFDATINVQKWLKRN